jgi:cobalt-zinc-cadmium efflux system protein
MHHRHQHVATVDRLRNAFLLTLVVLALELAAGLFANSLALLSDAGHILTDAFALALAWFATRLATRPPNERNTFGYQRSGILAALINALLLVAITLAVLVEASLRLRHPEHVSAQFVIPAALAAIAVNGYIVFGLRPEREENLNIRAAFLHVAGDIAASAAVVAGGILILFWHVYLVDPILSIAIAALIAYGAWNIVRDAFVILMEGAPTDVDLAELAEAMREVPGVTDVHDLHVWALSDGFRLLSAHVSIPDQSLADTATLLSDLKLLLHRRFHIEHSTIELECIDCRVVPRRPIRLERREESDELPRAADR